MNRPGVLDSRDLPAGAGAGRLSDQAERRLARPKAEPLRPPSRHDHAAVARWRASVHRRWVDGDPTTTSCGHRETTIAGVRCLITDSPHRHAPTVVYLHGGGFALGSPEVALPITDRLRERAKIVSVDYRLAPEHPFPAALDDVSSIVEALTGPADDRSTAGPAVVLAGDSAGAGLAVAAALGNPAGIAGLVLLSPQLDLAPMSRVSTCDPSSDVDETTARWLRAAYCDGQPADNPQISPLRANLDPLPPTLVQVGAIDSSLRQAIRFGRLARVAGVDVTLDVWDGLWHAWHYHRDLPEADRALAEASSFLSRIRLRPPSDWAQ